VLGSAIAVLHAVRALSVDVAAEGCDCRIFPAGEGGGAGAAFAGAGCDPVVKALAEGVEEFVTGGLVEGAVVGGAVIVALGPVEAQPLGGEEGGVDGDDVGVARGTEVGEIGSTVTRRRSKILEGGGRAGGDGGVVAEYRALGSAVFEDQEGAEVGGGRGETLAEARGAEDGGGVSGVKAGVGEEGDEEAAIGGLGVVVRGVPEGVTAGQLGVDGGEDELEVVEGCPANSMGGGGVAHAGEVHYWYAPVALPGD